MDQEFPKANPKKMDEENTRVLRQEIQNLLDKDWVTEVSALRLGRVQNQHAEYLMKVFARGIADTLEDQIKRNRIPKNYIFPTVGIDKTNGAAAYRAIGNQIVISRKLLIQYSYHWSGETVQSKMDTGDIKFEGTIKDFVYQLGIEEAKHSVDSLAGKIGNRLDAQTTPVLDYDAQKHEYVALGEKVLLAKKGKLKLEAGQTLAEYLQKVIARRRQKKTRE